MKFIQLLAATICAVALASSANAATFLLGYTGGAGGSAYDIHAVIQATPSGGNYLATSATGTLGGNALTLLPPGSCCATSSNNNILYSISPYLDISGIAFASAGSSYNLWVGGSIASPQPVLYTGSTVSFALASYDGTISLTAVPEPATWSMMILGMGGLGAALRRRRGALVAA